MKAALRDASFYACPSGHGHNPRPPKWHAIVDRPGNKWGADRGPACGIPFHTEETEVDAETITARQRCRKPGCKAAFAAIDSQAVGIADETTTSTLTEAELQILRHALGVGEGVGEGGLERSYRSHFVTGPGGVDHQHCMALVARGFMVQRAGNAITGGSDLFNVTQAGRAAVQEHTPPPPKLTRSQQRYQQFLRYDGGVTFGEYLRGWR